MPQATQEAMYVVFEDRNLQYRAAPGARLCIPLAQDPKAQDPLNRELQPGHKLTFDRVCLITGEKAKIGTPYIEGAKVRATVLGTVKGPKLVVQKLRRRKNSRRRTGFRARYTEIQIDAIDGA